jgi:Fe-S cluster assembly iron-binding protein IscA
MLPARRGWEGAVSFASDLFRKTVSNVAGVPAKEILAQRDLVRDPPAADDVVLARDGATVLVDTMSLEYMGGSEIDFVDDLMGQSFQIRNPHAVAGCGCGTSFSV